MTVSVDIRMPDFDRKQMWMLRVVPMLIAASVQTQRGLIFQHEGQWNGRSKWAPLKFRDGQILKDTGTLSKSIAPKHSPDKPGRENGTILEAHNDIVSVGTDIAYAIIHEEGRVYHGTPEMPLAFPAPIYKVSSKTGKKRKSGEYWIFCQKIVIPARPFGDVTQMDADEIAQTLANRFTAVL